MDVETRIHKERLLSIYQENLREMEIRAAKFGLNTPLSIINEIKYHRKNIDEIRIELQTNSEEVTFDKLLVGIEDLQRVIHKEGARVIREYNLAFGDQALLGFGLLSPLLGGIMLTNYIAQLYYKWIKDIYIIDVYNIVFIMIYIIGILLSGYFTFRLSRFITKRKHEWFIHRVGYDPFTDQRKD